MKKSPITVQCANTVQSFHILHACGSLIILSTPICAESEEQFHFCMRAESSSNLEYCLSWVVSNRNSSHLRKVWVLDLHRVYNRNSNQPQHTIQRNACIWTLTQITLTYDELSLFTLGGCPMHRGRLPVQSGAALLWATLWRLRRCSGAPLWMMPGPPGVLGHYAIHPYNQNSVPYTIFHMYKVWMSHRR